MQYRRSYLRICTLAIVCVCLLQIVSWLPSLAHIPVASAQAFVIGSDPIDGSTINTPPAIVRIYFNAPIASASVVTVSAFPPGGSGVVVNAGQSYVNHTNSRELDTPLVPASKLPQGSYEVNWTAISTTDGEATSGLIGFNLGQSSTGITGTSTLGPSTSNYFPHLDLQGILSIAWNWLVLLALFCWVGILITDYVILPRAVPPALMLRMRNHSRSLQTLCLLALIVGEVINLVLRTTSFTELRGGSGFNIAITTQLILHTDYGYLWLLRIGLAGLALAFLWWTGYRQRQLQNPVTPPLGWSSKSGSRFAQLRQQVRVETPQEPATPAPTSTPVRAHSQARITGAVAANVSPMRGTTAPLVRVSVKQTEEEQAFQQPPTWHIVSWLTLAGLILLTLALSNDIIQLTPLPVSTRIFSWLSLTAQATWFGSLAYLGLVILSLLPGIDPDRHTENLVGILKQAGPLLLSAIGVLGVSDFFLSEATIQSGVQLVADPYGRALVVRALLLLLMLIFTVYLLFFLVPRLQRQTVLLPVVNADLPARRTRQIALEKTELTIKRVLHGLTGVATAALLCLCLMNFFSPPVVFPAINYTQATQSTDQTPATEATQTQKSGGLSVSLQVSPARVGVANKVTLSLVDSQNKLVSNATVQLRINMEVMDMGITNTTLRSGSPTYVATFQASQVFSMAGTWSIQVEIVRARQQTLHFTFQVPIN